MTCILFIVHRKSIIITVTTFVTILDTINVSSDLVIVVMLMLWEPYGEIRSNTVLETKIVERAAWGETEEGGIRNAEEHCLIGTVSVCWLSVVTHVISEDMTCVTSEEMKRCTGHRETHTATYIHYNPQYGASSTADGSLCMYRDFWTEAKPLQLDQVHHNHH